MLFAHVAVWGTALLMVNGEDLNYSNRQTSPALSPAPSQGDVDTGWRPTANVTFPLPSEDPPSAQYRIDENSSAPATQSGDVNHTGSRVSSLSLPSPAYAPLNIGGVGDTIAVNGGFNVTASGGAISGTSDTFHLGYEKRTGNFDVRVRVARLTVPDPFVQAGLMAREDTTPGSRFAGAFASSAQLGAFFESRGTPGAASSAAAPLGGYPANFPQMWLRLQRSANQFTGFASFDGDTWTQLGSASIALPSVVYFGVALASATTNASTPANAEFRQIEDVIGGSIVPLKYERERLGPSSRRTGLTISEVMYHPKQQTDAKNLEFVEIYNGGSIFEDLSGFRLSGAIDYTFAAGTQLPAGAFLVVAKVPADVQSVYGLGGVFGPYDQSLQNGSGTIRLRDESDHVLLEAAYADSELWPAAADGAGHSLVLARPSYGEGDVRAWAASTYSGGSPGDIDPVTTAPEKDLYINEFLAHTDDPQLDFIELYNHSNAAVDISGFWISDDRDTYKFRVPSGVSIPARGFVSFDQNALGFSLNAAGETIYLVNASQTRVVDAIKFGGQENGVSSGRSPDGSPVIRRLSSVTPAAANSRWRASDVVINEIMYAPISRDNDDEYIELYNTTAQPINLGDWKVGGIDFKFSSGASIPAGGYVVIARNAARLLASYSHLNAGNTLGDFAGKLSSGERITLEKPDLVISTNELSQLITNKIYITVNEVTYGTGGRWSPWADGGGSSLELTDPRSDTTQADNWRESDETTKAPWSTVEFTGTLDNGNASYPPNQLQIITQGAGEFLVDQVEVIKAGVNYIAQNAGFESGTAGWVFQGNHSGSSIDSTGAFEGANCLHVRAPGRGDTGVNRIRTALNPGLASGNTATLRARVRWLKGWPEMLLRLRGSWLECAGQMNIPRNLGTPGLTNSRRVPNAGPGISAVLHSPALPAASQAVTVTARVSDPDGISSLNLRYRVDPATTLTALTMRDDGTSGDAVAGDGVYTATIPGRSAGNQVAFRIEATDSGGTTRVYPAEAPAKECLIRWGDALPWGSIGTYRMWMASATEAQWSAADNKDNTFRNMTFIYGADRVIYNAGVKDKGSPFHGGGGDAFLVTPDDEPFLGTTDLALCSTGNGGDEGTGQREQIAFWIARKMGGHYLHRRFVNVFFNGGRFNGRAIMEDAEEPNGGYSRMAVPGADGGDLYKIEDWFEFDDAASGFSNVDATLQKFTSGGAYKLARYRWAWRKRAIQDSANNYTNLFDLVTAVNTSGVSYVPQVENLVNVRNWMRFFALERIAGNWDSYGFSRGKNSYIYKGDGLKWEIIPWDIDFVLGSGSNGPTDALWGANDPVITVMFGNPAFQRVLWQAYLEAINGPLLPENYNPQMDGRYRVLTANGVSGISSPAAIKTYIDGRRNFIISQMNAANAASFAITTGNGNNFSTNKATVSISGTAPFAVYEIEVNGIRYPLTWTTVRDWTAAIPLTAASNPFTFVGLDRKGAPVAGASDTITVTYTGVLYRPEDYVVINEIMYHPAQPGASLVELYNRNANSSFDLSGFRFEGLSYVFPEGSIIPANGYLVLVQDRAGFAAAYGANILVFDQFSGSLDNGGERLQLIKPGTPPAQDVIIDEVKYNDQAPWPPAADGFGPSLQLIDAAQDNWPPANWAVTDTNSINRATPRGLNAVASTLPAFPKLYLNEVLANNSAGPADRFGEKDPWIELINSGGTVLDLSGLYLSDDYANLTKWQFPPGMTLAPGQFLVVWADNQPAQSVPAELHASFRLNPASGSVALSRIQNSQPAVIDYLNYSLLGTGHSYGSYPDGQPQQRRLFHFATQGTPNNPASAPVSVFINEWMAGNPATLADPADSDFDDWIELYNPGTSPVDLSAYTLTDTLTNRTKFTIPNGKIIPAGGYLIVWADEETGQNSFGNEIHANFKLALTGEEIGLFAPDGSQVDALTFGQQVNGVSQGRASDGAEPPFVSFANPTPRGPNIVTGGNQPPQLTPIGNKSVAEGNLLAFAAVASDPDAGQALTYSLTGDIPRGAAIHPTTGEFTWTPGETQGPGVYSFNVRVVDNGSPARSDTEVVTITVTESNLAPILASLPAVSINEGSPISVQAAATDADLPANLLTFSLDSGTPEGMSIDAISGEISWIPSEAQGTGDYTITVRVTDNGTPPLSNATSFSVHVNEVNNPPRLDAILPRTIDEGEVFTVTARALDPDSPASTITYTLEGTVPTGAVINGKSGVIVWPTSELDGPSTNLFTVRATENEAPGLTDTQSFAVIVREVNQAPTLSSITDVTVPDGTLVSLQAQARDNDLPLQELTFELLPGAPAGAAISSAGLFTWNVPLDFTASSYSITIKVSDNGPGKLSATTTFKIIVRPAVRVVINEIMYAPSALNAEYIELRNTSSANTWDLSGWHLAGKSMNFVFPAGTTLGPSAFLAIAKTKSAFQAAYGTAVPVLGDWTGGLQPAGDTLQLVQPSASGDQVVDKVSFGNAPPWPNLASAALQLVDGLQDNNRVANWKGAAGYNGPTNLVAFTSQWRFNQSGTDLGVQWRSTNYNDAAWSQGQGLLYVENAALPEPKTTLLTIGPPTYYFRTRFTIPAKPQGAQLQLRLLVDDGAVFYLNGKEIYRIGLPAGEPAFSAFSDRTVSDAAYEGPFTLPADSLLSGENVLAVEVHQANATSSDIVLGCQINLVGGQGPGFTPGQANSVASVLPVFEPLFVNEVLPVNSSGLADSSGDRDPWLELYNRGSQPVSLNGLYLTDSFSNLTRWAFPAGASIQPGEFKVIWLDGEPGESLGAELHTNFRVNGSGSVALVRMQNGEAAVIDYLAFANAAPDVSFGALPNGQVDDRQTMMPSPGAANTNTQPNRPPVLEPVPDQTLAEGTTVRIVLAASDPDPGQTLSYRLLEGPASATLSTAGVFSWTSGESDGPGRARVAIVVTDDGQPPLSATNRFNLTVDEVNVAPVLASIVAHNIAVGETVELQATASDSDLPAQSLVFSLDAGHPPGTTIDSASGQFTWTPSAAQAGIRYSITVRVTDGGVPALSAAQTFTINVIGLPVEAPQINVTLSKSQLILAWPSQSGARYRILRRDSAEGGAWQTVGEITAASETSTFSDGDVASGRSRFYRLEALP